MVTINSGINAAILDTPGFPVMDAAVGGKWLGALIAAGVAASAIGLYAGVLLSVSRIPKVVADDAYQRWNFDSFS